MKYDEWTKWYKQKKESVKADNAETNKLFANMTKREKETAELLFKQYKNDEKAIKQAKETLKSLSDDATVRLRENQALKTVAEKNVKENNVSKGDNRFQGEKIEKEKIENVVSDENASVRKATNADRNEIVEKLNETIKENDNAVREKIRAIDEKYDKNETSTFERVKKEIDSILADNKTNYDDTYYNVKDILLQEIEDNKESLGDGYDELVDFVESQKYFDRIANDDVVLYANDKQIHISKNQFEVADSVNFDSYGRIGLIYGDLLSLKYNGKDYKARAGEIATDKEKNVVAAICSRKQINPRVGTCIMYDNRLYLYAGDDNWRVAQERYKVNAKDGLLALTTDFKADLEKKNDEKKND